MEMTEKRKGERGGEGVREVGRERNKGKGRKKRGNKR